MNSPTKYENQDYRKTTAVLLGLSNTCPQNRAMLASAARDEHISDEPKQEPSFKRETTISHAHGILPPEMEILSLRYPQSRYASCIRRRARIAAIFGEIRNACSCEPLRKRSITSSACTVSRDAGSAGGH